MSTPRDERAQSLPATLWTVGHSTLALPVFLQLLQRHGIQGVADVRRFPSSRRHPQFAEQALQAALEEQGIAYRWLPELGGRREPRADSPNTAWRQPAFRGYADHLNSALFAEGLAALLAFAHGRRVAVLCAERQWRQCHRSLIADVLSLRGIEVLHLLGAEQVEPHVPNPALREVADQVTYPATESPVRQGDLFATDTPP